jgi:signal transduction histidine kinase
MTEPTQDSADSAGSHSGRDEAAASAAALPREAARKLAHDLRTPLSAMAGWIHLLESGALDEAGKKRALAKLRGNIDDQVKTIERYLGAPQEGQNRP